MSDDNGWGAMFHRHFASNEIHRDGGPECTQPGSPRPVYVFDPDILADHDRRIKAEAAATALEEAAEVWGDTTWQDTWATDDVDDDVSAVQSTVRWLLARATEIRKAKPSD